MNDVYSINRPDDDLFRGILADYTVNEDGFLVDIMGRQISAYPIVDGQIIQKEEPIFISTQLMLPRATKNIYGFQPHALNETLSFDIFDSIGVKYKLQFKLERVRDPYQLFEADTDPFETKKLSMYAPKIFVFDEIRSEYVSTDIQSEITSLSILSNNFHVGIKFKPQSIHNAGMIGDNGHIKMTLMERRSEYARLYINTNNTGDGYQSGYYASIKLNSLGNIEILYSNNKKKDIYQFSKTQLKNIQWSEQLFEWSKDHKMVLLHKRVQFYIKNFPIFSVNEENLKLDNAQSVRLYKHDSLQFVKQFNSNETFSLSQYKLPAKKTTDIDIYLNLSQTIKIGEVNHLKVPIYDSQGNKYRAILSFQRRSISKRDTLKISSSWSWKLEKLFDETNNKDVSLRNISIEDRPLNFNYHCIPTQRGLRLNFTIRSELFHKGFGSKTSQYRSHINLNFKEFFGKNMTTFTDQSTYVEKIKQNGHKALSVSSISLRRKNDFRTELWAEYDQGLAKPLFVVKNIKEQKVPELIFNKEYKEKKYFWCIFDQTDPFHLTVVTHKPGDRLFVSVKPKQTVDVKWISSEKNRNKKGTVVYLWQAHKNHISISQDKKHFIASFGQSDKKEAGIVKIENNSVEKICILTCTKDRLRLFAKGLIDMNWVSKSVGVETYNWNKSSYQLIVQ